MQPSDLASCFARVVVVGESTNPQPPTPNPQPTPSQRTVVFQFFESKRVIVRMRALQHVSENTIPSPQTLKPPTSMLQPPTPHPQPLPQPQPPNPNPQTFVSRHVHACAVPHHIATASPLEVEAIMAKEEEEELSTAAAASATSDQQQQHHRHQSTTHCTSCPTNSLAFYPPFRSVVC